MREGTLHTFSSSTLVLRGSCMHTNTDEQYTGHAPAGS